MTADFRTSSRVLQIYRRKNEHEEECFNVEVRTHLNDEEQEKLEWLLSGTSLGGAVTHESQLKNDHIVEIGPRLNFATPYSTNAVAICHAADLKQVTRLELSQRYVLSDGTSAQEFFNKHADRMTQMIYHEPLSTFETGIEPEKSYTLPIIEDGEDALREVNTALGLGMDDWDITYYTKLFRDDIKRNPTVVEIFQLSQANSEHSRHWYFKGRHIIDNVEQQETLMEIVQSTLKANPNNSLVAFSDNSSVIKGYEVETIIPQQPGLTGAFQKETVNYDFLLTAETHNFPSSIAPVPAAETGTGGRIRDVQGVGRGGLVIAGTAGYCVGDLAIPDYDIPGEKKSREYPSNIAQPLDILIGSSNGASDYGNKFGEPVVSGFVRSGEFDLQNGERRAWIKPIMFTGGVGQVDHRHLEKDTPAEGMKIVQIGGPMYRIGMGGGAASSMMQGENKEELDFNAVQRGDAEMEQKMNRVVRACVEMGEDNPIRSIHDQGAGGPCNVITELVEPAGGQIDIRKINVGDSTMSVLEIWGAEAQERDGLLIRPEHLEGFQALCEKEGCPCEVLGEVTGSGKIVVYDSLEDSNHVDLELEKILGKLPQKTFESEQPKNIESNFAVGEEQDVSALVKNVFALPHVGSKGFLVRKVDRSVTGLIAQQQCVGPLQLPVADCAVVAQGHFATTGVATSIGEQPIKMLLDAGRGARMAVAEALTNIAGAGISGLEDIKCSLNWMWAPKLPGEGALLYTAAQATRDAMITLGIAVDGGKDSLSMATKVGDTMVKSPGEMTISTYAPVPDITKVITPDIKQAGASKLLHVDLGCGNRRLGGSALVQVFGEVGSDSPDIDNLDILKDAFESVRTLVEEGKILSLHDISDGGLVTCISEMIMSGNCGAKVALRDGETAEKELFAEEAGWVIEYLPEHEASIWKAFKSNEHCPLLRELGTTTAKQKLVVEHKGLAVLKENTAALLSWWEATSDRLEEEQMNVALAKSQAAVHTRTGPQYKLTFTPEESAECERVHKVAIIREEGSNGDREMASAFFDAGFEVYDVSMKDLTHGDVDLSDFRGVAFVGGFSYADVLGSAKGWAAGVRFNERLKKQFDDFYHREDTFSLGVCNGCQLMAQLGWVPSIDTEEEKQPRFANNASGRFESRFVTVKVEESPAIMLKDMAGSSLGVWVAHGEGKLEVPHETFARIKKHNLAPLSFVDDKNKATEQYPFNPNGSPEGVTALCSKDGRHLAMMPHPERVFRLWQWPWLPEEWKSLKASPWLKLFQNAKEWCDTN